MGMQEAGGSRWREPHAGSEACARGGGMEKRAARREARMGVQRRPGSWGWEKHCLGTRLGAWAKTHEQRENGQRRPGARPRFVSLTARAACAGAGGFHGPIQQLHSWRQAVTRSPAAQPTPAVLWQGQASRRGPAGRSTGMPVCTARSGLCTGLVRATACVHTHWRMQGHGMLDEGMHVCVCARWCMHACAH